MLWDLQPLDNAARVAAISLPNSSDVIGVIAVRHVLTPSDCNVARPADSKASQQAFIQWRNAVGPNCARCEVRRDADAADRKALVILKTAQADAVFIVVQVNRQLNLSPLDLIWDLGVSVIVSRDREREAG